MLHIKLAVINSAITIIPLQKAIDQLFCKKVVKALAIKNECGTIKQKKVGERMSELNGKKRADIKIGALVDIVLKKDQRTGTLTRGHVKRILTNSAQHPHGIKVMLEEDNQVGRVQKIITA